MDLRRFFSVVLASRLWLLLALAPYLFLSAAGDSCHNHPLFTTTSASDHSALSHTSPNNTAYSTGDCLACWWLSQGQSPAISLALHEITVDQTACVYTTQSVAIPIYWRIAPATRGPPLV